MDTNTSTSQKILKGMASVPLRLYIYGIIVGIILYFIIRYWKMMKVLGFGLALAAALPILTDAIAAILSVTGGVIAAMLAAYKWAKSKGASESFPTHLDIIQNSPLLSKILSGIGNCCLSSG